MNKQRYQVVVGNLHQINDHNARVSELLDAGFTLWGQPIQHGLMVAQTVYFKEDTPSPRRRSTDREQS